MKTLLRRHSAGFTLIELMATITIIVILAGIVVAGMGYVNEKQAREKAKVQIELLSKAIEEYKMDMGAYPGSQSAFGGGLATSVAGDFSQVLYTALFYEGYEYSQNQNRPDPNNTKATKIYLPELDPRTSKMGWVDSSTNTTPPPNKKIIDPWGNNYRYRTGNGAQNPDFDLWSYGKDNKYNNSNLKHKDNNDDVRNF